VFAYYLLHSNHLSFKSISYSLMNVIGASFILYSLILDWNTPAVIMESIWIAISLSALFKAITKRNA
ncbi:MAG TPA: hypothetical protein PLD88_05830, partial [Candidatus Berkiella sp.]|nr:hypothetical protein [Candidatus Berkiella sp.]